MLSLQPILILLCVVGGAVWWYSEDEADAETDADTKADTEPDTEPDTETKLTASGTWVKGLSFIDGIENVASDDKFKYLGTASNRGGCMFLCQRHGEDCKYLSYTDELAEYDDGKWKRTCFSASEFHPEFLGYSHPNIQSTYVIWR